MIAILRREKRSGVPCPPKKGEEQPGRRFLHDHLVNLVGRGVLVERLSLSKRQYYQGILSRCYHGAFFLLSRPNNRRRMVVMLPTLRIIEASCYWNGSPAMRVALFS
jgi:hypothetical protein